SPTPQISEADVLVSELHTLRASAGNISYAEITQRISADRVAAGLSPAAAQIARSTVYDAFRLGRKRVNTELVIEIVRALGVGEAEVNAWRARCAAVALGARRMPAVAYDARGVVPPSSQPNQYLV